MALPEIVQELFSALYESRTGVMGGKAKAYDRYKAILKQSSEQFGFSEDALLKLFMPRYRRWVRENRLPPDQWIEED